MDTVYSFLIVGNNSGIYDQLGSANPSADIRLYFCGRDENIPSFVQTNGIRSVLLDAGDKPEECRILLRELKAFDPLLQVAVTGPPVSPEEALEWVNSGALDYFPQPVEAEIVFGSLRRVFERQELRRETSLLERKLEKKYVFQGMVSRNPAMLDLFALVERISRHFSSVLITGETGTGKELMARALFQLSETKARQLVVCDCASIPDTLFESELFGHVRGAFTGADRTKKGLFEEAHEGVIFMDEIGEIPLLVQSKLLRVLENRQFRPIGGTEVKYVSARVIAATNRDLPEMIKKNTFREDLFHRLNRVEIHIPPLRDHMEDIPLLIRHFLDALNKSYGKSIQGVSRDVQKLFLKYGWPGNVRELENALQSAVLVTRKDFIDLLDLPKSVREPAAARRRAAFVERENLSSLEDLEKEYIAFVLAQTKSNLKRSAEILGVSRTTLYNKLAKYGLDRAPAN
ncbi:MAG: sigma-54-dependent Fis family transcriptional regulator [Candidatus Aminicenantes bacterium]|nr:sigma-54-dependent Fis family transcriptional regulator [Candidatus Aminicenantes bacterium]